MPVTLQNYVHIVEEQRRKSLIQLCTNNSVFFEILPVIEVDGLTYEYSEQATTGSIAFRNLNAQYADDVGVVVPKVETLSILGGECRTDHQLASKQGGIARSNAIAGKVKRAGLAFDRAVIQGPSVADPAAFDGLNQRLIGLQAMTADDGAGNGGVLTLGLLDELIDRVGGPNATKYLIMCKEDRRNLKSLLIASAGGAAIADMGGSLALYDGIPIQVIDEHGDPEDTILGKIETIGADDETSSIYCIQTFGDQDQEYMRMLLSNGMPEVYESGMQGVMHVDIVELNASIGLFHGRAAARLKGLKRVTA